MGLDNSNTHRSLHIRRALPNLARHGVHLFSLPPDSPELNDIEPSSASSRATKCLSATTAPCRNA
ncbi:transposase [Corallococcus sp. NCSPR001]|uniref:transposase n=1 Tax=Corallococcus sp. NCRR TaxID=2996782 RepID=UPI001A8F1C93|nr:transposase [Corallococcus sp. NCSPR001]